MISAEEQAYLNANARLSALVTELAEVLQATRYHLNRFRPLKDRDAEYTSDTALSILIKANAALKNSPNPQRR